MPRRARYDDRMQDAPHNAHSGISAVRRAIGAVVYLLGPFVAGGLGAVVTTSNIAGWYRALDRPTWTPPDWVFGPVWTALYLCIGVAGWLVARRGERTLVRLWWVQFALNAIWSPVFFGLHQVAVAAVIIVAMWGAIAALDRKSTRLNSSH